MSAKSIQTCLLILHQLQVGLARISPIFTISEAEAVRHPGRKSSLFARSVQRKCDESSDLGYPKLPRYP